MTRFSTLLLGIARTRPTLRGDSRLAQLVLLLVLGFLAGTGAAHSSVVSATFNDATNVPVTALGYTATGNTVNLTLNFAPETGAQLMVVKTLGLDFISGTFSNLAQGQEVTLSYRGVNYKFVANYFGGTGNDLVLQWADTKVYAWGQGYYGTLGNNSTSNSNLPVAVLASGVLAGRTVIALASGDAHSLALCSDGTVAAWGRNDEGQLGNNSKAQTNVPVVVSTAGTALAGRTVVALSAGVWHSLALCSDGTVVAWGKGEYGQLGLNTVTQTSVPTAVSVAGTALAGKSVIAISASGFHSLALCADGTVVAWGSNDYGQLGNNSRASSSVPVAVTTTSTALQGKSVIAVSAGFEHSLALCTDGTLAAWGSNNRGELGNNNTTYHYGSFGDLGFSTEISSPVPVTVNVTGTALAGKAVAGISAGNLYSVAQCADGTVVAWGTNQFGELGNSVSTLSSVASSVSITGTALSGKVVTAAFASAFHTLALCSDGTLAAWGSNSVGLLGNGSWTSSSVPVGVSTSPLPVGARYMAVTRGTSHHVLALVALALPSVSATFTSAADVPVTENGYTATGQTVNLALNFAPETGAQLMVVKNTGLDFISGTFANLAQGQEVRLTFDGVTYRFVANYYGGTGNDLVLHWAGTQVWSWGENAHGQLGIHSSDNALSPVAVTATGALAGRTVTSVSAGYDHSLALCSDGKMFAWGRNILGQLGNGGKDDSDVPVAVSVEGTALVGRTVVGIAAGAQHSLALCSDGTVVAWGSNLTGELGDNSYTNSSVPVAVAVAGTALDGKSIVAVASGTGHSLALCSDGTVVSWGSNLFGQLGSGLGAYDMFGRPLLLSSSKAVRVAGGALAGKSVIAIASGGAHSLALCSDGSLAAWGWNIEGQLGNNSTFGSEVPLLVSREGTILENREIIAISAGEYYSLALCADGTMVSWGLNNTGQLGNGSFTRSLIPTRISVVGTELAGKRIVSLASGSYHAMALSSDGCIGAWGAGNFGQQGDGTFLYAGDGRVVPHLVSTSSLPTGSRFIDIASGSSAHHNLALVALPIAPAPPTVASVTPSYGNSVGATFVTITGSHFAGATGVTIGGAAATDVKVVNDSTITCTTPAGRAGPASVLVTTSAGTNAANALYTYVSPNVTATFNSATDVPVTIPGFTATGGTFTASLNFAPETGTQLIVVNNTGLDFIHGRLTNLRQGQYVTLSYGGVDYPFVANYYGGTGNDLVLVWAGTHVWGWGYNSFGQVGNGSTTSIVTEPTAILKSGGLFGQTVIAVAAGSTHSLALCSDGTMSAWGSNVFGQLGNNFGSATYPLPTRFPVTGTALEGKTVIAIAAGDSHNLALCTDGTVAAWGRNAEGQLGNNSTLNSPVPVSVSIAGSALAGKTVVSISAGYNQSLALCSDGTVVAWGNNAAGQLVNNGPAKIQVPMAVSQTGTALEGKTVIAVSAGSSHSLALCSDGTVAAWGWNQYGTLGNGSTLDSHVPVAVSVAGTALEGKTVTAISAGDLHSLALCSDGTVVAWGRNPVGQLGNNTKANSSVPVAVQAAGTALAGKTVTAVMAGYGHSLARCSDGTMAAWGSNHFGQLGNNSRTDSPVPVAVRMGGMPLGSRFAGVSATGTTADFSLSLVAPAPRLPPPTVTLPKNAPVLNRHTGLFEWLVQVKNPTPLAITGFDLVIGGLPKNVSVWNGYPEYGESLVPPSPLLGYRIHHGVPVGAGQSVTVVVEFFSKNRQMPKFTPTITASIVPSDPPPGKGLYGIPVSKVVKVAGRGNLVQFRSVVGSSYRIWYSVPVPMSASLPGVAAAKDSNLGWLASPVPVVGHGSATNWMDEGPPKTAFSPLDDATRQYRVELLPAVPR